jgi:hypothetical protein
VLGDLNPPSDASRVTGCIQWGSTR